MQTSQAAHPDSCPLPKVPAMGKRVSELDPSTMEEDRPHLMNHLYITWMAGCVLFVVLEEASSVMLWAMFSWETFIIVDVTSTRTA